MWSRIPDTAAPELCWAGAGSRDLSRQETQTVSCGSANCQTGICRPISGSQARARVPGAFCALASRGFVGKAVPCFSLWYQRLLHFCASHRNLGLAGSVWPILLTVGLADSTHSSISAGLEFCASWGPMKGSSMLFWLYFSVLAFILLSLKKI